ncbi:hypothetical protein [Brevibacillus sp. 179-C9.3 HS]|uniref:hypothetical protein n=1 Tax=unclassified Brevibacillus TaxID=2684853 RepID=UPI0039A3A362
MDNMRFHRGKMVVDDHEILIFQLEKGEVTHQKFERLLSFIADLDKRQDKGFGSLMLAIDGWDHVPEELYEIPQVRKFMVKLIRMIPHLLFYLNPVNQMPYQLLASLSDVQKFYHGPVTMPEYIQGQHDALIKLPREMATLMLNAIKQHAETVQFDDKDGELPVIYGLIERLSNQK